MSLQTWPAEKFIAQAGALELNSDWYEIDQERINKFANVTQDHQFIHVDEDRAKTETSFGGTIAHGFLSLSLLSAMIHNCIPRMKNASLSLNYGFDKIRFLNPVPSGSRIRGHFKLMECNPRNQGEIFSRYHISVEIENIEKPALVAEWLSLAILNED